LKREKRERRRVAKVIESVLFDEKEVVLFCLKNVFSCFVFVLVIKKREKESVDRMNE